MCHSFFIFLGVDMKLRCMVFWLLSVCVYGDFLAMELEVNAKDPVKKSQVKSLDLSDVTVDIGNGDQEELDPIVLLFEAFLEKKMAKKMEKRKASGLQNLPTTTPRQAILPIKNALTEQVEALKITDPELYQVIINFKKEAEANGKTTREIEGFIKQNLDQLPPQINTKTMYKHLYNAKVATEESKKKKDYELREVLDEHGTVDLPTLLHAVLYRSASVQFGKEEVKQEVKTHESYLEQWLAKVQQTEPEAYAILMKTYEQAKNNNVNQQSAIPQLLNAVDQVKVEALQLLLKDVQKDEEVKTTRSSVWSSAYKLMGVIISVGMLFTTGTGSTLGALFGISETKSGCTAAQCIAMNITNCTNITG